MRGGGRLPGPGLPGTEGAPPAGLPPTGGAGLELGAEGAGRPEGAGGDGRGGRVAGGGGGVALLAAARGPQPVAGRGRLRRDFW